MTAKRMGMSLPPPRTETSLDGWVQGDPSPAGPAPSLKVTVKPAGEKVARLTIDLPQELHGRFKAGCALKGTKMAEIVTGLIDDWIQKNS